MASTKSDQNPDKRDRSKPKDYLSDWIKRQSLVEKMIPMIGNLHREKNVRILLYGNPLITLSVSQIMQEHRLVRETEKNELSEFESYAKALDAKNDVQQAEKVRDLTAKLEKLFSQRNPNWQKELKKD